jgi:subtilase family serine protease
MSIMNGNTFLRWLQQSKRQSVRRMQKPRKQTLNFKFRPQLEGLEERVVPAAPYTPAQIRAAYGVDQVKFGATAGNGAGQTIALVVNGIDTSLMSDLKYFDQQLFGSGPDGAGLLDTFGSYNGPVAGSTKPWFDIVQDTNPQFPPTTATSGEDEEADLEVEWAHAMAPMANILEVQSGTNQSGTAFAGALQVAQPQLGISVIANSSYLYPVFHPEDYSDQNVTYVNMTGGTGASINSEQVGFTNNNYPASSPLVMAVGGTTLTLNADGSYGSEAGWGFAGPNRFLTSDTAAYSPASSWTVTRGGFSGTYFEGIPLSGTDTATWTTTVTASDTLGREDSGLEISATWPASSSNVTNAKYLFYDNGNLVDTVSVNQLLAPTGTTGTLNSRTATFQELCALTDVAVGDQIEVVLDAQNAFGSVAVADAIGLGPDDASGGGFSNEPQPSYQAGLVIHNGTSIIPSGGFRTNPDVAFDGDKVNSPVQYYDQGSVLLGASNSAIRQGAGTALGAPCWAGLIAIADQGLALAGQGPMNTAQALTGLYSLPSQDFHDETSGYNGYSAGPGYDLVTGLGSPVANQLLPDLDKAIVTHFHLSGYTGVTTGLRVAETVTALNAYGNVVPTYTGTVHFTSTDASASLPGDYTFLASDGGSHTFSFTMQSSGPQYVTVTDTSNGEVTGQGLIYTAKASSPSPQLPTVAYELTHSYQSYYTFVAGAYEQYLGRVPSLSEANGWITDMQQGLSDEWVEALFIGSTEYIVDHGGAGAGWVRGMYENLLGRMPAQSEVDQWVADINAGLSTTSVAYGFSASIERETNRVTADYTTYLNRVPGQSEVQGWVNDFEQGLSNETVIAGFVGSLEFYGNNGGGPSAWLDAAYVGLFGGHADLVAFESWMPVLL